CPRSPGLFRHGARPSGSRNRRILPEHTAQRTDPMAPAVHSSTTTEPRPRPLEFDRVGRIVAVTGSHAIILLDSNAEFAAQGSVKSPEIGTLLKVDTANSVSLALVSALSAPAPSHGDVDQELRIVEVEFI